jgi:hypothetical protein
MPAIQKRVQLKPEELEKMRHLTHELTELLGKISNIVHSKLGEKDVDSTSFTVALPRGGSPLSIGFGSAPGIDPNKNELPRITELYELGYADPPGV